ncbi:MAG: hypothetical protein ABI068_14040 [Ktedonobacterales bacterium]
MPLNHQPGETLWRLSVAGGNGGSGGGGSGGAHILHGKDASADHQNEADQLPYDERE